MTFIYSPAEDSYLLKKVLEKEVKNKSLKILEIGVGSGFILEELKKKGFEFIFGIDINFEAVDFCKRKKLNVKQSNLFSNVTEKYDLIIFNPPYLPFNEKEDKESSLATSGGTKGGELINKFLKEAEKYLVQEGKIYLLISTLSEGINWLNWKKELINSEKLFFEKLEVWKLTF